tara:strand:+ start:14922 stop:15143 length:222 start_codon:yes stop_codon:yes gene_type:complete
MKKSLLTILIATMTLVGCKINKPDIFSLNIYQPSIIKLKGGESIQTADGVYTPQFDEIWHSDKRFRELERNSY